MATAYMVEVWPYSERSRGISVFQLFGRLASFFTTFVNPIGLAGVGWRYLISYCCWLAFEVVFVYFMFPETFGRTLEELAFSKSSNQTHHRAPHSLFHHVGKWDKERKDIKKTCETYIPLTDLV